MRLYLAGRMRGRQFFNFPAFDAARDTLTAMGHTVVSPADIDRANGFDGMALDPSDPCDRIPDGFDLDGCILGDIAEVLKADGVCFIDLGWYLSKGARAECATAIWRGKRLFIWCPYLGSLTELTPHEAERYMIAGLARGQPADGPHAHIHVSFEPSILADPSFQIFHDTGTKPSMLRKGRNV